MRTRASPGRSLVISKAGFFLLKKLEDKNQKLRPKQKAVDNYPQKIWPYH